MFPKLIEFLYKTKNMVKVEILAIGNELLIGDVLDTNTNWIIKKITGMGGQVNRSVILRDNLDAIATEIQWALHWMCWRSLTVAIKKKNLFLVG